MVKLLACAALLAACYDERYRCTSDAQCDLGVAGRCELDGYCTAFDASCATRRAYAAHAGELTGQCFDDAIVPINPCTGGQPPAPREGCYADVCSVVPACCDVAWTDVCVQLAEQACDTSCDLRLAITATRGTTIEHYDARWVDMGWTITPRTDLGDPFVWVAPVPGTTEPRLAGTAGTELVIGDAFRASARATCTSISASDVDRDGRDTIVVSYSAGQSQIWKLDDGSLRDTPAGGQTQLIWGDENRDAFPDAVNTNAQAYRFIDNLEDDDKTRQLLLQTTANVTGGATPGPPEIRSVDWGPFSGDDKLDLLVFGSSVRIHTTPDDLSDIAQFELDCDPPTTARPCTGPSEPDRRSATFTGAAFAGVAERGIVIAVYPGRKLYRARAQSGNIIVEPLAFPNDTCTCPTQSCSQCPGPNCTCTYDCSTCATVAAVIVRDVNGDRELDITAIDSRLRIYTALAPAFTFGAPTSIVMPLPTAFEAVDVSVAGAPIP